MIEFNMVKLHKIKSLKAITGAIKNNWNEICQILN